MRMRILPVALALVCGCTSRPEIDFATPTPLPPSPPTGIVTTAGDASITISWTPNDAVEAPMHYTVYGAQTAWSEWSSALPGAFSAIVTCTSAAPCSHVATSLENETDYWLAVSATNSSGEGSPSSLAHARPPPWGGRIRLASENGTLVDHAFSVVVESDESLLVSGCAGGPMVQTTAGGAFLARFRPTGAMEWIRIVPISTCVAVRPVVVGVAPNGNATIAGTTSSTFFGQTPQGDDAFLVTFDAAGNRIHEALVGSAGTEVVRAIAVDDMGNVYLAGETTGSLPGNSTSGGTDAFVAKYDSAGVERWIAQEGTAGTDIGAGVAASANAIWLAGHTDGSLATGNAGGNDYFVVKLDAGGTTTFARQGGSTADEWVAGIALDSGGNAYISGNYSAASFVCDTGAYLVRYPEDGSAPATHFLDEVSWATASTALPSISRPANTGSSMVMTGASCPANDSGFGKKVVLVEYAHDGAFRRGWQQLEPDDNRGHDAAVFKSAVFIAATKNTGFSDGFVEKIEALEQTP